MRILLSLMLAFMTAAVYGSTLQIFDKSKHNVDQSVHNKDYTDNLNLSSMILPVDTSLFVKDKLWYNWCNSVVKGEDGKYHLFYARFPKSVGFNSWLVFSEIAHSVGDTPVGPYVYKETVMPPRPGHWDAINAHNVKVEKFGEKYYMYYISTNNKGIGELNDSTLRAVGRTGFGHSLWMPIRNNQRSGVAVSNSVNGPWKRLEKPIVEPHGPICHVTVNPSVVKGPDKQFYMIVKGDDIKETRYARLIQAVGVSKSPTGPFKLLNKPAFDDIETEDASVWYDKKRSRFYAIFHAQGKDYIGLITSEDGKEWKKAKNFVVCKKQLILPDGSIYKINRMERPSVYQENGELKMLSFAVMKGNDAFIVFLSLKSESEIK